jgi:hypothetical protein
MVLPAARLRMQHGQQQRSVKGPDRPFPHPGRQIPFFSSRSQRRIVCSRWPAFVSEMSAKTSAYKTHINYGYFDTRYPTGTIRISCTTCPELLFYCSHPLKTEAFLAGYDAAN